MWLFSAAASLFVAAPVALTATWQVPRGTKISRNISLKSIFRLFREIYSSERKIVTLPVHCITLWVLQGTQTIHVVLKRRFSARHLHVYAPNGTHGSGL